MSHVALQLFGPQVTATPEQASGAPVHAIAQAPPAAPGAHTTVALKHVPVPSQVTSHASFAGQVIVVAKHEPSLQRTSKASPGGPVRNAPMQLCTPLHTRMQVPASH